MKLTVVTMMLAGLVIVGATPAYACTCVPSTPAEVAERNDAAFVGTYLGRTDPVQPGPIYNSGVPVVNHFSVERVVKGGPIGDTVDVAASGSSASCGLELGIGRRTGLGLKGSPAGWTSDLCNQADAAGLLAVGQPVNPPPPPPPPPPSPVPLPPKPSFSATPAGTSTAASPPTSLSEPTGDPSPSPSPTASI